MKRVLPIVGAFYRPPAKALLAVLASDTPLVLRPEPENPHDANAVMVVLKSADIPESAHAVLRESLPPFGSTLEEVLAQEEWHIGYIPRTEAEWVQEKLAGRDCSAKLSFAPDASPMVSVELE